jgi:HK97 family phage major capsid protein
MEKKEIKEYRNSAEYIEKLADAIKSEDFAEVRAALLTTNAEDGTIAVPDFVYDIVKTAWDKNEIMGLVDRANIKGNLKVNFEISGGVATIHTEGGDPVPEEELVEGIVTIIPQYVKKWKSFSDEVMSLRGEAFLRYIYDELAYRIIKKMADQLVAIIAALPQSATATSPSAGLITAAPAIGVVAEALGELSDEAANPVVVMNKKTWSLFKAAQYAGSYSIDPFEGFDVHFNNSLPAYASAEEGDVYMIVGDFGEGALANFPNGDGIEYKFDELTRKKEDLVEVLGKVYVGLGVVADKAFALVAKPTEG